jgi:uncharacterized membrane protein
VLRQIAEFTRTTLIGGLLVVLPIYITLLLVAKTVQGLLGFVAPITSQIPASVHWRGMVAGAIVVGICFLAGLVVRTGPGLRAKNAFEAAVLEKIPGYSLVRGLAGRVTGTQSDSTFAVALVEIEDALVPAFIVEELADGNYTVFVPSVPTPAAGAIYILPASRVHPVDVPFTTGLSVISRWGQGAGELLKALERQKREVTTR